jgi:multiple sugar transport system permease protein/putative aldouronate transport system permease protein
LVTSKTIGSKITDGVLLLILFGIAALSFAPLLHTLAVSLSEQAKASSGLVTLWPVEFTFASYQKVLEDNRFFEAAWVSAQRVFWTVLIGTSITMLLAYPLSRQPSTFGHRNFWMWSLIFVLLFNGGLIPFYMTVKSYGLLDSLWALVIPTVVNVFNVILVINFFRSIPRELDDCANIDGAGPWRALVQIYMPLSIPVVATIILFNVVGTWNEYFLGLIFINSQELYPLQTYMQQLIVKIDPTAITPDKLTYLESVSNKTLNSAKIIISMIPIIAIYPFLQQYFITGIILGSVKE